MEENKTKEIHILTIDDKTLTAANTNPLLMKDILTIIALYDKEEMTKRPNGLYFKAILES
jgi:hypothetical protein